MIENAHLTSATTRAPRFPWWLVAAFILFVGVRVYGLVASAVSVRHTKSGAKTNEATLDSDAFDDLIATDLTAKEAYIYTAVSHDSGQTTLVSARGSAESLVDESGNLPAAARRLMILRALTDRPPFAPTRKGHLPLAAFTTDLPADAPPIDRAQYGQERAIWLAVYARKAPTTVQAAQLAQEIRRIPNIRWWSNPAIAALYSRSGNKAITGQYNNEATNSALTSIVEVILLGLARLLMFLVGIGMLIALPWLALQRSQQRVATEGSTYPGYVGGQAGYPGSAAQPWSPAPQVPVLWVTEPERLSDEKRRLSTADLGAVFLIYILTGVLIEAVATGFSGLGPGHIGRFSGVMNAFRGSIDNVPAIRRMTLDIVIEAVAYIVTPIPAFIVLLCLVRRRGVSLADEIGLTRGKTGQNIVYGIGGYCLATPIFVAASLLAPHVFRNMPAPSNPVIPELVSVSGMFASLLLIVLASVAAPFVEEVLFRGVLYNAIRLRLGVWPAILLSGFIFGFVHPVGVAEMVPLAVLGCVFAWMAQTRQSLLPSMVAHCCNNLTSALMLMAVMQS